MAKTPAKTLRDMSLQELTSREQAYDQWRAQTEREMREFAEKQRIIGKLAGTKFDPFYGEEQ